jgi:hypothetical protein
MRADLAALTRAGIVAIAAMMFMANSPAQAPAAPGGAAPEFSAEELDQLVGPIALYPDDLVAIILPASTNPLQLVQADRFLEKRKADSKLPVDDRWDDAVKSLLNYPEVVKKMSSDLDWTSALGEAVVADQGAVLEAVQVFRRKAQAVGNLKSDQKQTIVVEKEVIKIVQADPQVIYVPQYNPSTVVVSGGYTSWGYYPSPYPVYYYPYPPGAALATGIIWGAAIGAAWNGGHYGANYSGGGNTINIDNSRTSNRTSQSGGGRQGAGSGSSQWKSNKQPGQVSGSTGRGQSARVGDTGSRGGAGAAGGARPSAQPAGGGRDMGGGGAFGGANSSGRQAQMDSSRGASSRGGGGGSSISGSGARQVPSSGGVGAQGGRSGRSGASTGGGGMGRGGGGGGGGGRGGGGGGGRR